MRAGRAPSRTHLPHAIAFPDLLSGLHVDIGQMEVHADEAIAVIDEHRVAGIEKILRQYHRSVGNRQYRRAGRHGIIAAHMRLRCRLAVEDAVDAEGLAFGQRVRRLAQRQGEPRRSLIAFEYFRQQDPLARIPLQIGRRWIGLRDIGQLDLLRPVATRFDGDAGGFALALTLPRDGDHAGFPLEVDREIACVAERRPGPAAHPAAHRSRHGPAHERARSRRKYR